MSTRRCLNVNDERYLNLWHAFQQDEELMTRYDGSQRMFMALVVTFQEYFNDIDAWPTLDELREFEDLMKKERKEMAASEAYGSPTIRDVPENGNVTPSRHSRYVSAYKNLISNFNSRDLSDLKDTYANFITTYVQHRMRGVSDNLNTAFAKAPRDTLEKAFEQTDLLMLEQTFNVINTMTKNHNAAWEDFARRAGLTDEEIEANFERAKKRPMTAIFETLQEKAGKEKGYPLNEEEENDIALGLFDLVLEYVKSIPAENAETVKSSLSTYPQVTIEPAKIKFNRIVADSNPRTLYIFTDNTDRTSGGTIINDGWYKTKYGEGGYGSANNPTTAIIRGLNNAAPISTMRYFYRNHPNMARDDARWTDTDFNDFKLVIDAEFAQIESMLRTGNFDKVMFPSGDGLFNSRLAAISKERTPTLYAYLKGKQAGLENFVNMLNATPVNENPAPGASKLTAEDRTRKRYYKIITELKKIYRLRDDVHVFVAKPVGDLLGLAINVEGNRISLKDEASNMVDDETAEDRKDSILDGEDNVKEHWMQDYRGTAVRDTLSWKVRVALSTIDMLGFNNRPIRNFVGFPKKMNMDEVKNILLRHMQKTIDSEDMIGDLEELSAGYPWGNSLLQAFDRDNVLEVQFWGALRKDLARYDAVTARRGEGGLNEIRSFQVNASTTAYMMLNEWQQRVSQGVIYDDKTSLYDAQGKIKTGWEVFSANDAIRFEWSKRAKRNDLDAVSLFNQMMEGNALQQVLGGIGVSIKPEVLRRAYVPDKARFVTGVTRAIDLLYMVMKSDKQAAVDESKLTMRGFMDRHKSAYLALARVIEGAIPNAIEDSARINGKTVYSFVQPSYLTTQVKRLGNVRGNDQATYDNWIADEYGGDTATGKKQTLFYAGVTPRHPNGKYNIPWLNALRDNTNGCRDMLAHKVVLSFNGNDYGNFGDLGYALTQLINYEQGGDEGSFAWYSVPVLSDAPSAEYVRFMKHQYKEDILYDLFDMFLYELTRVNVVNARKNRGADAVQIENFDRRGDKFLLFTWMEDPAYRESRDTIMDYFKEVSANPVNRDRTVESDSRIYNAFSLAQLRYMNERSAANIQRLKEVGLLQQDANQNYIFLGDMGINPSNVVHRLNMFFWNNYNAQMNLLLLTVGDLAYYKDSTDLNKRIKELHAPGQPLYLPARYNRQRVGKDTERYISVEDVTEQSSGEFIAAVTEMIDANNKLSADEKKFLKAKYKQEHMLTDGQTYRTLQSWRSILAMYKGWNDSQEMAYQRLLTGQFSMDDYGIMWQAIKPYVYTNDLVDTETVTRGSKTPMYIRLGYQRKNSEALLLPALFKYFKSPELQGLYEAAIARDIDAIVFHSCEKTGGRATISIKGSDNVHDFLSDIDYTEGSIKTLNLRDYKVQQPTPEHLLDHRLLFGSQARTILPGNLLDGETITHEGEEMTKEEAIALYDGLITENLEQSLRDLIRQVGSIEKLQKLFEEEILGSTRYSRDLLNAVTIVELKDEDGNVISQRFAVPLADPVQRTRTQQLLNSVWKKQVVRQRITGGTAVQVSNYGVSNRLKIETYRDANGDTRLGNVEVLMPFYTNRLTPRLKEIMEANNGHLPVQQLLDEGIIDPEFLEGIAYRTPTEAKYSILPIKIVGFLPRAVGGNIIGPKELPMIMGIDFDIDKLNIILPALSFDEYTGQFRTVKPQQGNPRHMNKQERDNALLNLSRSFLLAKANQGERLSLNGFDNLKKAARVIRLLENPKTATERDFKELSTLSLEELDIISRKTAPDWNEYMTQMGFYKANVTAAALISFFANASMSVIKRQRTGISLKRPEDKADIFTLGGRGALSRANMLHAIQNDHGQLLSLEAAQYLAASVDAIKDPVMADMGINKNTVGVVAMLVSLGYPAMEIGLFLRQPAIRRLNERLTSLQQRLTPKLLEELLKEEQDAYNKLVKAKVRAQATRDRLLQADNTPSTTASALAANIAYYTGVANIKEQDINNMTDAKQVEYFEHLKDQAWMLQNFKNMIEVANVISALNRAMKVDTQGGAPGPTVPHSINKWNGIEKAMRDNKLITGNDVFEDYDGDRMQDAYYDQDISEAERVQTQLALADGVIESNPGYLQAFYTTSMQANRDFMQQYYPELSRAAESLFYSVLDGVVGVPAIPVELMNSLIEDISTFQLSESPYLNPNLEENIEFLDLFPGRLEEILQDPYLSGLMLFRHMRPAGDKVVYYGTGGITNEARDQMITEWEMLWNSGNPDYQRLASDLFRYAFLSNGARFGVGTFMHLAPAAIKTSLPVNGEFTYADMVEYHVRDLQNYESDDDVPVGTFLNEYVMNHASDPLIFASLPRYHELATTVKKMGKQLSDGESIDVEIPANKLEILRSGTGYVRRFFKTFEQGKARHYEASNIILVRQPGEIVYNLGSADLVSMTIREVTPHNGYYHSTEEFEQAREIRERRAKAAEEQPVAENEEEALVERGDLETKVTEGLPESDVMEPVAPVNENNLGTMPNNEVVFNLVRAVQGQENRSEEISKHSHEVSKERFDHLINKLRRTGLSSEIVFDKERFDRAVAATGQVISKEMVVRGFTRYADKMVYINPRYVSMQTPLHEMGHLWLAFIRDTNQPLWRRGKELVEGTAYYEWVNNHPFYRNKSKEEKLDEALAFLIGDNGELLYRDLEKKESLAEWLIELWNWIRSQLNIRGLDASEIATLSLGDFVNGAIADLLRGEKIARGWGRDSENRVPLQFEMEEEIINEKGELNYGNIERGIRAVQEGVARLDRLPLDAERSRVSGGTGAIAASIILGAKTGRDSGARHDEETGTISEEEREGERLVKEYAQRNNLWINPGEIDRWQYLANGAEAIIFEDPSDPKYVFKLFYNVPYFSKNLQRFLDDRVTLHNHIFRDTHYEVVGFTEILVRPRGSGHIVVGGSLSQLINKWIGQGYNLREHGMFYLAPDMTGVGGDGEARVIPVVRQEYREGPHLGTSEFYRIGEEMKKMGFAKIYDIYERGNYTVGDLHVNNVKKNKKNPDILFFLDTVPALGNDKYGSGEIIYDPISYDREDVARETDFLSSAYEIMARYNTPESEIVTLDSLSERASTTLKETRGDVQQAARKLTRELDVERAQATRREQEERERKDRSTREKDEARTTEIKAKAATGKLRGMLSNYPTAKFFNTLTTPVMANLEELSWMSNISIEALEPLSKFISKSPAMQSLVEQNMTPLGNLVDAYLFMRRTELMQPSIEAIVSHTGVNMNELLEVLDDVRDENIDESMRKCR